MTLIEALMKGKKVIVTLVNEEKDVDFTFFFVGGVDKQDHLVTFFNAFIDELEYLGEPTEERPFEYGKLLFVNDTPFNEETLQWDRIGKA